MSRAFKPPVCNFLHECNCGTAKVHPHVIGTHGCCRHMAATPEPFGVDPETKMEMWLVEGNLITEFTMIQQRGYHRHGCGCWSHWGGSTNSISDET